LSIAGRGLPVGAGGVAMKKPVLIGGGLAVLVLVIVFFAGWTAGGGGGAHSVAPPPPSVAAPPSRQEGAASIASRSADAAASSAQPLSAGGSTATSSAALSPDDRRKRLAQVRSDITAMMSSGALSSPEKALALINELEQLSPGNTDPRYFQTLRNMLESTSKIQALNTELQRISGSSKPEDLVRRQEVLSQLQQISTRISADAADLQSTVRRPAAAGKP